MSEWVANTSSIPWRTIGWSSAFNDNAAAAGGGVYVANGSFDLLQTIIANSIGGDCFVTPSSTLKTNDNNLIEDGSFNTNAFNLITGNPLLSPLGPNNTFNDTYTHRPLHHGSKVVDAVKIPIGGNPTCGPKDQRGFPRPGQGKQEYTASFAAAFHSHGHYTRKTVIPRYNLPRGERYE